MQLFFLIFCVIYFIRTSQFYYPKFTENLYQNTHVKNARLGGRVDVFSAPPSSAVMILTDARSQKTFADFATRDIS